MPCDGEQIFSVPTVVNGEGIVQSNAVGVFTEQPCPYMVKSPGPGQGSHRMPCAVGENAAENLSRPALHLRCRPTGEREEQDALRVRARENQMSNTVGKRVGLA